MIKHLCFVLLLAGIFSVSCNRSCSIPRPTIHFTNYDSARLNVVIVKAYSKNAAYPELISTAYYSSGSNNYYSNYDTIRIDSVYQNIVLEKYYDYRISIPGTGREYYIRNITVNEDKSKDQQCTSSWSCYVDDVLQRRVVIPISNQPANIDITL